MSKLFYGLILGDTSNDEAVYLEFTVNSSNRNEVEFKVTDTDENAEFTKLKTHLKYLILSVFFIY